MSSFPISYQADFAEQRSRLTTFFRLLMVIPHMIVAMFLWIAGFFTVIAAWLAVVITGKYPEGLYAFHAGLLRWNTRVNAYFLLATDAFPPFGLDDDRGYPVRLDIAPAKQSYSRLHAFFRLITAIPAYVVYYVLMLVAQIAAFLAWFLIVITGKAAPALQSLINMGISYSAKAGGYILLMHEEWFPPITDEQPSPGALGSGPGAAQSPLSSSTHSTTE